MKAFCLRHIKGGFLLVAMLWLSLTAPAAIGQSSSGVEPGAALADALLAACRQDASEFATHLTAENSTAYLALPPAQRVALLKRFVLLDDPGKPLLSTDGQGHSVIRCEGGGVASEMRLGAADVHDNLAFIPVTIPQAAQIQPGQEGQTARFGLVREDGKWKLLSLGILVLDVPALARQWERQDLESRENLAAESLRRISSALDSYLQAYGRLPQALSQMGPPSAEDHGKSPDKADLIDAALASGQDGGYRFRYDILAKTTAIEGSPAKTQDSYQLAATPVDYGKDGKRSFFLDSGGVLRGADKHGGIADAGDPVIAGQQGQPEP